MASQLRLHVLLPIVVLGALGAAVGAFMVGNKPPDDSGVPLITTHPDKKTQPTKADWATKANAWCADVSSKTKPPAAMATPEAFENWYGEAIQVMDSAEPTFEDLGWPPHEKAAVMRLRQELKRVIKAFRSSFNRYQAGDFDGAQRALEGVGAGSWDKDMRRLGADTCVEDQAGTAKTVSKHVAVKPADELILAQLQRYPKVVVLFYKPDASYDAIQTREARAGALAAHAGFVAVDVTKNREVAQLAQGYDVLESPTVLIFVRPLKLKARIEGLYDRTVIMQAVRNA
jgi:hypothetical protein